MELFVDTSKVMIFLLNMTNQTFNKIIIAGDAARGKTTLAKKISEKLNLPYYSTDDALYEVKFTVFKNKQEALDEMQEIYNKDKWIVEGTTHNLLQHGFALADLIIHLKFNSIFYQWHNLIRRHFKRKDKSFIATLLLLRHVFYKRFQLKYEKGQRTTAERIDPHKHKVITLTSFKEIDEFVDSIA